jgi:hypothetical protein
MNGGVAVDLTPNISGNNISGVIDLSGVSGFAAALASGGVYLNLHTANEPNGEIRGQVLLEKRISFDAKLDTAQQTGPVTGANGNGSSFFTISNDFTSIDYSVQVEGLSGAITAAHLHEGVAGTSGGVLVDLTGDINGNTISGTISGAGLTQVLITELLESGVYINVHTAANPNGELRGQINRVAREGYSIIMNGAQEVPAVSTMASGGGIITVSRDRNNAHVMLVAQNMAGTISGAHLHNAAAGSNGGVLFDLTGLFTGNESFSSAFGYLTSDDSTPFNGASEVEARNNRMYVNIHNATNANGEIRGQVYRGSECNTVSALGLEEANKVSTLSVYPNPVGSSLTISKENFVAGESMKMISISGQVVKTIVMTQNGQTVNIADLKTGVYFLQGANTAALKVVKL